MTFHAGQYTFTYNAKACGQTADGIRISHQFFKRLITGDQWGDTPIDAIYRGCEMLASMRLLNYDALAVPDILWPYGATKLKTNTVGLMDVQNAICKQGVLTSVIVSATEAGAGTVGSAAPTPATRTIPLMTLQENFPIELLFAPDLREVPLRFRLYPNNSTGIFGSET